MSSILLRVMMSLQDPAVLDQRSSVFDHGSVDDGTFGSRAVADFGLKATPIRWEPAHFAFPLSVFDFPGAVGEALGERDLSSIGVGDHIGLCVRATDQQTRWHEWFYRTFGSWQGLYRRFLNEVVADIMGEEFYFQAIPNLRVHLPNNLAVGEFHTDRTYGHPDGELTFWVPLTPAYDTNTLLLETAPSRGDYVPVEALPGTMIVFDAGNLEHGNVLNTTGKTRASFDFRCIPVSRWRLPERTSINMTLPFAPGGYYAAEPIGPRS